MMNARRGAVASAVCLLSLATVLSFAKRRRFNVYSFTKRNLPLEQGSTLIRGVTSDKDRVLMDMQIVCMPKRNGTRTHTFLYPTDYSDSVMVAISAFEVHNMIDDGGYAVVEGGGAADRHLCLSLFSAFGRPLKFRVIVYGRHVNPLGRWDVYRRPPDYDPKDYGSQALGVVDLWAEPTRPQRKPRKRRPTSRKPVCSIIEYVF